MWLPLAAVTGCYLLLCVAGALLCCYSYHVEVSMSADPSFTPVCDLTLRVSCTRVLQSEYSRGLGVVGPLLGEEHALNFSTALYGLLQYSVLFAFGLYSRLSAVAVLVQSLVVLLDVYLLYVLLYVLEDLCVVCVTTYMLNGAILAAAVWRWNLLNRTQH